jgi:PDZ domain
MIEGRRYSYDHSATSALTPTDPMVASLSPDRSSRLETSKTPHHRTNFPYAYKPPVPPGYEPPPNRYMHPLVDDIAEPATEAFAAAMRGPMVMDAISITSEIPFDQQKDQKDRDADSQPGRIKPPAGPRRFKPVRASTPTEIKTTVPPTARTSSHRSRSPVSRDAAPPEIKTASTTPGTSSYRSHSPVPVPSRVLTPTPPPEIKTVDTVGTTSYRSRSPVPTSVPSSPSRIQRTNSAPSSSARPMAAPSPLQPFDETPPRVTPSPTNAAGAAGSSSLNRSRNAQQPRTPPSLARSSPLTTALLASDHIDPFDEPPSLAGSYRMAPPRVSLPRPHPYGETVEDEPSALTGDFSLEKPRRTVAAVPGKASDYEVFARKDVDASRPYPLDQKDSLDKEEDDDSLFDFEERSRRDRTQQRGRHRASSEESDDTSQGDDPASLQQRAQAAWKRKQRLNVAAAETEQKLDVGQSPVVSFGKNDIVHNYDPLDSLDADDTVDSTTLGGHSINSLYTKSAESEVEDIIKDIFMIGSGEGTNPGRRKLKYNPRIREHIERQSRDHGETADEDTYDDEDTTTYGDTTATFTETTATGTGFDSTTYSGKTTEGSARKDFSFLPIPLLNTTPKKKSAPPHKGLPSSTKRSAVDIDEKKEEGPLTDAWAFVGNKISAVGAALGLESSGEASIQKDATSSPEKSPKSVVTKEDNDKAGSGWDLWQYLLGPTASSFCEDVDSSSQTEPDKLEPVKKSPSLVEDVRLVDLAVQAAMSMHRLNGYEFDTSYDLDIANDIKFSVVSLTLPLGVIFHENEMGCWVTQILPEGSAFSSKGYVQVGDQLAAVDGSSAIDMTVDEIATLIRVKKREIELTFLRYVGPLRPEVGSIVKEEGYEISATATPPRKKKLTWSPPSSPKQKADTKVAPIKPAYANRNAPKGILKTNTKPTETAKPSKSKAVAPPLTAQKKANEPKKRFRLFGRRKPAT